MYGILGTLPFMSGLGSVFTPHAVDISRKNSFAKHKILNSNDVLEDTGVEPIDVTLEMGFMIGFTLDPVKSVSMLSAFMDAKIPAPLIVGNVPVGRGLMSMFVVESMSVKVTKFFGTNPAVVTASVKLLEYAPPPSPLTNFLSNPVGALAGGVGGIVSSIGLPGPRALFGSISSLGSGLRNFPTPRLLP
jgi:hypothetical protein